MHPPPLTIADHVFPALAGIPFCLIMALVREPARRRYNAVFVGGASGVYMSGGGFGLWEVLFTAIVGGVIAYLGLRSYRWIGIAWLMHSGWDVLHHFWGNPIWPFAPTSSWGCMIFDAVIALWFLAGAPSPFRRSERAEGTPEQADSGETPRPHRHSRAG